MSATQEPGLDGLVTWQANLSDQAAELRSEIARLQSELADVEERLVLVTRLIDLEARAEPAREEVHEQVHVAAASDSLTEFGGLVLESVRQAMPGAGDSSGLEDAVEEILRSAGEPLHISDIRTRLASAGVPIPGRGDDANIIVRLRRLEDRFTRTARGTYGLAEWGLPALKSAKRKRSGSAR